MNDHIQISDTGKAVLEDQLQIRTDLDLRASHVARPELNAKQTTWVNIPVIPYAQAFESETRGKDAYQKIFALLAREDTYPLYFHCWGGADRAGTLAFLLGALLGVSEDDLIHDYELTSLSVWGDRNGRADIFLDFLARLKTYGDTVHEQAETFISEIGISQQQIGQIRSLLLETV